MPKLPVSAAEIQPNTIPPKLAASATTFREELLPMSKLLLIILAVALFSGIVIRFGDSEAAAADKPEAGLVVHNVYFSLKDSSDAQAQKLIDACKKYLKPQPGVVYFACGRVAEGLDREVNDRDWEVGLHVVFKDRASHDKYQDDPQHKQFIAENKDNWAKVRVFDTTTN